MPNSRQEIPALTGLRAVAAFWVLGFHFKKDLAAAAPQAGEFFQVAFGLGYLGVDLFFILSGFIISYNYAHWFRDFDAGRYLRFLWARLTRIYPVHLCALLVLAVFVVVMPGNDTGRMTSLDFYAPERWLMAAAMWHGWEFPISKSWNVPSWSVSSEWLAYLLFPLAACATLAIRRAATALLAMALLVGLLALLYATIELPGTMAYGLPRIAVEFPIGCLLYRLYRSGTSPFALLGLVLPALLAVLTLPFLDFGLSPHRLETLAQFILAPCVFAALIYILASGGGGALARGLDCTCMRYLGRVSYSLYVVHFVIIIMAHRLLPTTELAALEPPLRLAVVAGVFGAMLLAAMASYHFIEEPSRRSLRAVWPARSVRPAVAHSP